MRDEAVGGCLMEVINATYSSLLFIITSSFFLSILYQRYVTYQFLTFDQFTESLERMALKIKITPINKTDAFEKTRA